MITITYNALAAEAEARWHPDATQLSKALAIVTSRNNIYNLKCPEGEYDVRSQTSLNGWYHVDTKRHTCTCTISRRGHACQHRLAVWMYIEQRKRSQEEARRSGQRLAQQPT